MLTSPQPPLVCHCEQCHEILFKDAIIQGNVSLTIRCRGCGRDWQIAITLKPEIAYTLKSEIATDSQ